MKKLTSADLDHICEQQLFNLPYFRGMLRAVEQSFYEQLDLATPILDVGAGDGHFASALFRAEPLAGIDPWLAPLKEASSREVYGILSQAQGDKIPFPAASFPTVISNSVLEHIPEVQPVLNDIGRVTEPGGRFIFAVPNQRFRTELWGMETLTQLGLGKVAPNYSRVFNRMARHHNLDSPEVWVNRLHEAGFAEVEYWNYFPKWAMQMLERGHVAGLPNLLWKKLFGKWVLFPSRGNPFLRFKKVRTLLDDPICEEGTCTFFLARRAE